MNPLGIQQLFPPPELEAWRRFCSVAERGEALRLAWETRAP